ncbi:hypothetical protein [Dechloromonas denitrificans]|uniref:hypothetical protein n=1 Tax=Dechloromonas denitrificans TaxID=281362 RepID=UPI001CF913CF|nr:hypothetical protein [Dechloromonas denitrificans]UCV01744.1 hypothetical protein KI611_11480 [Dechloromonas denitrificans]
MAAQLPYGAAEIVALRTAGKRPADLLLISLIGPLSETNPVIIAQPSRSYDWRFVVALPVLIVATTETPHLSGIVKAIDTAAPAALSVWFADQQDGVNLLVDGYRPRTKTGRRMSAVQRATLAGLGSAGSASDCLLQIAGQVKRRAMENAEHFDAALIDMATAGFRRIFGAAWGAAS